MLKLSGDEKMCWRLEDWHSVRKKYFQAIVTIVKVASKFSVMKKVESNTSEIVAAATIELLRHIRIIYP